MSSTLLRFPGWSGRLWASLAALFLTAAGVVAVAAPQAAAAPDDPARPFATYNMQGSLGGARWNSEVGPLAERFPVVAVQEAGSGPPPVPQGFDDSTTIPIPGIRPHPNMPMTVNQSPLGVRGGGCTRCTSLETHVTRDAQGTLTWGGQRVNLAVVTQEDADDVRVVDNSAFHSNSANDDHRSRRALGIRLGKAVRYNIHARGASDFQQLLAAVRRDVPAGLNYVILGDFNRNIRFQRTATASITAGAAASEYLPRPNQATHQGGTELVTRAAADEEQCPGANPFDRFRIDLAESPAALDDESSGGVESGPVRRRNALWPSLCLTATGRQEALRALPCTDSDAQLWWESSRAVPSDSWHTGGKWVRLRADNGSCLDARGGGTDDLTRVVLPPGQTHGDAPLRQHPSGASHHNRADAA
ncbi:endonuclease/exonuclease/phosphatase family protein [Streptomyces mirabilis]